MSRGRIFNEEKILYFASGEELFHVQPDEPKDTDCRLIVKKLLGKGLIVKVHAGDSGEFYGTTRSGDIRLLELQINWRRRRGKNTDTHEERLQKLLAGGES